MARDKFQAPPIPLFDENHESDIRLLIIDCHFIVYRNSFHIPYTLCNENGFPTFGIKGFLEGLSIELNRFRPTHVACAFDGQSKDRMAISEGQYKDNRRIEIKEPTPDQISMATRNKLLGKQFKHIRKIVEAMGYPVFHHPDHEADDVINTLTISYPEANIVILSRDKDFNRRIRKGVRVVDTTGGNIIVKDTEYIKNRYGIHPKHFSKYLALVGDKADNVGKVKGIGPVTAAKWLKTHSGSLKDVLKHELTNKKDREIIKLGYKLTKMNDHAIPAPPLINLMKAKGDPVELKRLLDKFEIKKPKTL